MSVYLRACLSDCLYPIGPKFFVGPHMTTGNVNGWSKFQKLASNKIRFSENLKNSWNFFIKSANFFCFCLTIYTKRKCSQLKKKMDAKRPESLVKKTKLKIEKKCYLKVLCIGVKWITVSAFTVYWSKVHLKNYI